MPTKRRSKHLCAAVGYRGAELLRIIEWHGYIPHVVNRRQESSAKQWQPGRKTRRWVVEVCHSWFNRFRKLLVRYEKLDRSFMALNHLAAAIITLRKVQSAFNIIYGSALSVAAISCRLFQISACAFDIPSRSFDAGVTTDFSASCLTKTRPLEFIA